MTLALQSFLILLFLAGPVPLSLTVVARGGTRPVAECWTLLLLAWCTMQIVAGTLLGIVGFLHVAAVAIVEASIFALGWVTLRGAPRPSLGTSLSRPEASVLSALTTLGLLSLVHLAREPTDNVDSLLYHLPQIARWVQDGRLSLLDHFAQIARYPFGWEVVNALFVLPRHDVMLVALPNLVAWCMVGCGVTALARRAGASRMGALAAAALLLSVPQVVERLLAIQVDLVLAAFFLAALAFGTRSIETRSAVDVVAAFAATGCILAVKLSGLAYVGVLAAICGLVTLGARGRPHPPWPKHAVAIGILATVLIGGFWYVRNIVDLGNPFGHVRVEWGDRVLLDGTKSAEEYRQLSLAHVFRVTSGHDWKVYGQALERGLGLPFLVLVSGACLMPWAALQHPPSGLRWRALVLLVALAATTWMYWSSPYTASNGNQGDRITPWVINGLRYGFPALAMLGVVSALGWRVLRRVEWLLAVLAAASVLWRARVHGLAVLGATWGAIVIGTWIWRRRGIGRPVMVAAALVGSVVVMHLAAPHRDQRREELFGDTYVFLRDHVPEDATFGILSSSQGFLLHGPRLTRRVVALEGRASEREAYLQILRDEGIQYVASGPLPRSRANWRGIQERRWMSERDGRFQHVFGSNVSGQMYVYRFDDLP